MILLLTKTDLILDKTVNEEIGDVYQDNGNGENGNGNGEGVSKVTMDIGAVKRQEDQKNVDVHAIVDPDPTQFDMPRHLKKELG